MKYIYDFLLCTILIIFQTAVLPQTSFSENIYDLLIIIVVYKGLYHRIGESVPVIIYAGIMMDSFSGGTFGTYLSIYFWIFISMRLLIAYLDNKSRILFPSVSAGAVLIENIFLILSSRSGFNITFAVAGRILISQVMWAAITGPLFIYILKKADEIVKKIEGKLSDERSENSF